MSYKSFDLAHDVASLVSAINEVVTISSSLFTTGTGDVNVKFYDNVSSGTGAASGGYWQTVYDSSPTGTTSTAMLDFTFGYSTSSVFNVAAPVGNMTSEKSKVYREMASVLLGNADSTFAASSTGTSWNECFFIMAKRGLMKDEVKKGTVEVLLYGTGGTVTGTDTGAASAFKQTVGGDYAPIFSGSTVIGLAYYNAGVVVIPASGVAAIPWVPGGLTPDAWSGSDGLNDLMASGTIDDVVDGLRAHIVNVAFHNQTNLYSTVYFCRATNTEFNYSSNPTYVDSSTKRILVTSGSNILQSRTYVTTVGLYDANDNLLAVGKLNKPITKSPDTESIFRVRLDY